MKSVPIILLVSAPFWGMAAIMYFVVEKIKPMEAELGQTKQTLSARISDLQETEDKFHTAMESQVKLQNSLDAAKAKIADLEVPIKRLQSPK